MFSDKRIPRTTRHSGQNEKTAIGPILASTESVSPHPNAPQLSVGLSSAAIPEPVPDLGSAGTCGAGGGSWCPAVRMPPRSCIPARELRLQHPETPPRLTSTTESPPSSLRCSPVPVLPTQGFFGGGNLKVAAVNVPLRNLTGTVLEALDERRAKRRVPRSRRCSGGLFPGHTAARPAAPRGLRGRGPPPAPPRPPHRGVRTV